MISNHVIPNLILINLSLQTVSCSKSAILLKSIYSTTTTTNNLDDWLDTFITAELDKESGPSDSQLPNQIKSIVMSLREKGLDSLHTWLSKFKSLYPQTEEEETTSLHRTSPLALYVRRTRLNFDQLSFDQSVRWWDLFAEWCDGIVPSASTSASNQDGNSNRTRASDSHFQAGLTQDYQALRDALRFYDYEPPSTDLKSTTRMTQPQYALFNRAFIEFESGGFESANLALQEAIQVARRSGDAACLAACASLASRSPHFSSAKSTLPSADSDRSSGSNGKNIETELTPTDLLFEIKRDISLGLRPLPALFTALYQSRAGHQATVIKIPKEKSKLWMGLTWEAAWQLTSSNIWQRLGSTRLAKVRERCVLEAPGRAAPSWDTRLSTIANISIRYAKSRRYEDALRVLFEAVSDAPKRGGMGVLELREWNRCVRKVLRIRAVDRGQQMMIDHIDRLMEPPIPQWTLTPSSTDSSIPLTSSAEDLETGLAACRSDSSDPSSSLPSLLSLLHASSLLCLPHIYLPATLLLISARLAISPTLVEAERSEKELKRVWSRIREMGMQGERELEAGGWEMTGRIGMVLLRGRGGNDEQLIQVVEYFEKALEIQLHLLNADPSLRLISHLIRLYDHLATSPLLSSTFSATSDPSSWSTKRNNAITTWTQLELEKKNQSRSSNVDWREMESIEGLMKDIERVVFATISL